MDERKLYIVTVGNAHVITYAFSVTDAKARAHWLSNDTKNMEATVLTKPGDRININLTLAV